MKELLDWCEKAGHENMRERIEVAGMIQREANMVLTLLLAGGGAALAYAGSGKGLNSGVTWAALAVSLHLFVLAGVVTWKCLRLAPYPSAFNDPKSLYNPRYPIWKLRRWELENLQERIGEASAINNQRSAWLNRVRLLAAFTPVPGFIGWGGAYLVADVALAFAALAAG